MTPKLVRLSALKHHWTIYYFLLPSLALIIFFQYIPVGLAIFHSFFRWNGSDVNEYVGMQNYKDLVVRKDFWSSFRIALIIAVWNIVKMAPAIIVAICISRVFSSRKQFFYRILFVAPMVLPLLVLALVWRTMFFEPTNGYLNNGLAATGLMKALVWFGGFLGLEDSLKVGQLPAWLGDKKLILFAVVAWGFPWVGSFAVLTHLAKLQSVPKELHEAVELDGAGWWTRLTQLELPMLKGSMYILVIFILIDTVRDATVVFALADVAGGPGGAIDVPGLFIFREAFVNQAMGATCAVAVVLALIVLIIKKLLDISGREELATWQRSALAVIGVFLAWVFYHYLESPFLATVMGAVVFPWSGIKTAIECITSKQKPVLPPLKPLTKNDAIALPFVYLASIFSMVYMNWKAHYAPLSTFVAALAVLPWPLIAHAIRAKRFTRPVGFPLYQGAAQSDVWTPTPREIAAAEKRDHITSRSNYESRLRRQGQRQNFAKHALIWLVLIAAYIPLVIMIIVSFKSNQQYYFHQAAPTFPLHFENWSRAWNLISPSLANSIFITIGSTALTLFFALGGAYFFARVQVPGSKILWTFLVPLMVIPQITYLVPLFGWLKDMSMLNTLTALIAVGSAGGQVFAMFVLRNFIADLPQDLFEAAEVDGASHFTQLFKIVAPLSAPILGVIGLMHAVGQWNEFMLPLVIMSDNDKLPVMVQLLRMNGEYIKEFGPLMAGYALASVPVILLFIACMRLFTRGLTEGAVKG